jgi:hypothetical protein
MAKTLKLIKWLYLKISIRYNKNEK